MNKKLFILIPLLSAFSSLFAQKVEFYGQGRAVVENNEANADSTLTTPKTTGGYTLMDLGFDISRGEILKANTILRVRNGFGSFDGDDVTFEFRQMRLEGLIGKVVKYELGDLDMKLTPYTIYNFDPVANSYESELFSVKRDVVNYENFYTDENTWRLQGVNTFTTLKFNKGIKTLGLRAFGTRTLAANTALGQADRFLYGASANINQGKFAEVGVNYVEMADIAGTLGESDLSYDNSVFTGTLTGKYDIEDVLEGRLEAEFGQSSYSHDDGTVDTSYTDGFYDVAISAKYLPLGIKLKAGYSVVGTNFISPAAQSRRYTGEGALSTFPTVNEQARTQTIFDRYSQESGLTNTGISPTLMGYLPIYNNINPYGVATPNRQGINVELSTEDKKERFAVNVRFQSSSEIEGVNTEELRSFTGIQVGAKVNINRFIGWRKQLSLQGGYASESTKRDGLEVDLTSSVIDAGLDIEFLTRLHLLVGYKAFSAKGNEWFQGRNQYNVYEEGGDVESLTFDETQGVTAFGLKYNFSNRAFFVAQAQLLSFDDKSVENVDNKYDLTNIYFNYTLNF
ncbi:MAG: hypothetical protein GY827_06710 [Cytophagales bacterium]|nr:hypothetical protein [Cytophagales bacterium]